MSVARSWAVALIVSALAGSAFAQGFRRGGFGGPLDLLGMTEVQKELKLDEAQLDLLKQLGQEMAQKAPRPEDFQNGSRAELTKRFAAIRTETEKKVGEILEPKQTSRLRQLEIQRMGGRALSRKDVQDELKLSADQRLRIQTAIDGEQEALRGAFQGFQRGANMTQEQRDEIGRKFREVRAATEAKVNGVLSDAQKKQFQTMQGAPFKFPENSGPFGRRPRN